MLVYRVSILIVSRIPNQEGVLRFVNHIAIVPEQRSKYLKCDNIPQFSPNFMVMSWPEFARKG
jgi:hypothetical protein